MTGLYGAFGERNQIEMSVLKLEGKRCLVTGASSGIGTGIAQMLIEEGARVVVHGRNADRLHAVAKEIGAQGVAIADLSDNAGADRVRDEALACLGHIDVLINNAGGALETTGREWLDITEDEWIGTYHGNTLSSVRLIRRLAPAMKELGWGRIIQISSATAIKPMALGPDYAAAKAAVVNLTVSLAIALRGTGITSNAVTPGAVMTPAMETWARDLGEAQGWAELPLDQLEQRISAMEGFETPSGRIGRPSDIALAVCMLASPGASYINGVNIRVDGGMIGTTH